jgi:hypothetical protein
MEVSESKTIHRSGIGSITSLIASNEIHPIVQPMPGHSDWAPRHRDRAVYSRRHPATAQILCTTAPFLQSRAALASSPPLRPRLLVPALVMAAGAATRKRKYAFAAGGGPSPTAAGGKKRVAAGGGPSSTAAGGKKRAAAIGGGHQEARGGLYLVDRGALDERQQRPRALLLLVVPHGAAAGSPNPSGGS